MTSVRKMKRNLFVGIIVTVTVFMAVAVTLQYQTNNETEEKQDPIPQILILPPPPLIEDNLDLHPPLDLHPLNNSNVAQPKFEIKLQNEIEDEVLEVVATLADAKEYIKEYGEYHDDLFVYDMDTQKLVLTSNKNE
jgi:hypothetical protein|tara:strand:+ start:778 stop:1185 length:408 start_codon:yes stop_codon:yes gene_type:complete